MYNALSAARGVLVGPGRPSGRGPEHRPHAYLHLPDDARVEVDLELRERRAPSRPRAETGRRPRRCLVDVLSEQSVYLEDDAYSDWALRPGKASN